MKRMLSLILAMGLSVSLALPASALEVEDAKELIKTYYVDQLPTNFDEIDDLEELLSAINDPYTDYLTAEEYGRLQTSINGKSVVGVGATVHLIYDNGFQIMSVLPNSPALETGLEAGDVITAVDGHVLTPSDDVTSFIGGEEGTPVTLTVRKGGSGQVMELTIVRQTVSIPIVTYDMVGNALGIQCDSFGQTTPTLVRQALEELEEDAVLTIMDLRRNPGGTSVSAAGSVGLFLGGGIASYFRNAEGDYNRVFVLNSCPDLTDKPVLVLTSNYSASGSELFAAAIRDKLAGIGIGQRTFGKGVAQNVFNENTHPDLFDGDAMKITVYRFFSPTGATNHTVGVIPTLVISDENTVAVSKLLSSPAPEMAKDHLRLELGGYTFYIHVPTALAEENRAAFTELLEALPPNVTLFRGIVGAWSPDTPEKLAQRLGLAFTPRTFADTAGSMYGYELDSLAALQLVSGFEDGSFRPQEKLTRGQFCAMVSAALNLSPAPELAANRFTDISADSWMAGAVGAMADYHFISGFGDGSFRPNDTITYQEVLCTLNNVGAWATMKGHDYQTLPLAGQAVERLSHFAPWAQVAARNMELYGALLPEVEPTAAVTREQGAASLYHLMDGCNLLWH